MDYPVNITTPTGKVLEAQSPTIRKFWERLLPAQNAELPCMQEWQAGKYQPTSFKDVHAQAHCTAGYLMRRGLRKGDHVGIIAHPGMRYHVMQIALQYLGAVNVTIPHNYFAEEIDRLAQRYHFKLLFVDSASQFLAYGEFKEMKEQLLGVVIGEDDVDALDPEKIVTYDRVVTLGKAAWREEANELKAMKAAMLPQDLCAILLEPEGKATNLKMEQWMQAVDQAEKALLSAQVKNILVCIAPDRLLWRAFGFAAVFNRVSWWIRPLQDLRGAGYLLIKPEMALLDPTGMRLLYDLLPELIDVAEKGRKAITLAMEVVRKRDDAKAAGKKDPIMNRLKYSTSNRKLYKRIRTKLGGKIAQLVIDKGLIDADARLLFEEASIKITQGA
jgi:long-subunit acyl-CoA synthetase (AMP-forming)